MSKNVAVFVDVANIFYAAKAAGVDIDYVQMLKTASAGRDLVRAYAWKIILGTDGNTPWAPHTELEDMVIAGLTPMQAIMAGTKNAADSSEAPTSTGFRPI